MKKQNNWRDQLRNRRITPSDEAWLSVEAGLESKSKNKLKQYFVLSLIAASLVGFVVYISLPTSIATNSNIKVSSTQQSRAEFVFPAALFLDIKEHEGREDPQLGATEAIALEENQPKGEVQTEKNSAQSIHFDDEKGSLHSHAKAAQLLAEVEMELAKADKEHFQHSTEDEAVRLLAEAKLNIEKSEYQQLYQYAKANDLLAEAEESLSQENLKNKVWKFVKANYQNLENALVGLK